MGVGRPDHSLGTVKPPPCCHLTEPSADTKARGSGPMASLTLFFANSSCCLYNATDMHRLQLYAEKRTVFCPKQPTIKISAKGRKGREGKGSRAVELEAILGEVGGFAYRFHSSAFLGYKKVLSASKRDTSQEQLGKVL